MVRPADSVKQPGDHEAPLASLDDWEDDLLRRYPDQKDEAPQEETDGFRNYDDDTRSGVREFYRLNHRHQTVDFVRGQREKYLPLQQNRMGIWEAMEVLDSLTDDSDPDTELPQIAHAVQTAEAIRADGHPDWFILTGLIHDLGKVLCLYDEPQWAVVGDTFPVGCAFSDKIVLAEFFADNPDINVSDYQTSCGIYEEHCGLDNVLMSWGHDEYLYQVVKDYLPEESLAMIRYHSFYPAHREGEYQQLMNEHDQQMFEWVRKFNPYDLYTKSEEEPDLERLLPWYQELVGKFFPDELAW